MNEINVPVLFLTFNRPDQTRAVFERIRTAKPLKLYLSSDGPRADRPREKELVMAIREQLVSSIDWPCEVHTRFNSRNEGCKSAVSSAISWFFQNEEAGIILEDDCLPADSFFRFCAELLVRYRDDHSVMMISGDQFIPLGEIRDLHESYYFTTMPHIWGWATWRRAWHSYDIAMREWPQYKGLIRRNAALPILAWMGFSRCFSRVKNGMIDTWDHQWTYSIWRRGGLSICPKSNLVSNIGFGSTATHTKNAESDLNAMPVQEMEFPLRHPPDVRNDHQLTRRSLRWTGSSLRSIAMHAAKTLGRKLLGKP